jgi:hypothetical protein
MRRLVFIPMPNDYEALVSWSIMAALPASIGL